VRHSSNRLLVLAGAAAAACSGGPASTGSAADASTDAGPAADHAPLPGADASVDAPSAGDASTDAAAPPDASTDAAAPDSPADSRAADASRSGDSAASNDAAPSLDAGVASGPLTVLPANPRYFTDGTGRAVYLAGSHTWSNGMEDRGTIRPPLPFDFTAYVAFMAAHKFNWMRLWTSEVAYASPSDDGDEDIIAPPFKWVRAGPGKANDGQPAFDFTQLDPSYFARMRSRVIQAGQSGIYVSVMLFNGYMWEFDENATDGNPFESGNNANGVSCGATCPSDKSQIPAPAWTYETQYLQKVVDTVNDLPNVMYEVSNEAGSPYSDSWEAAVIAFVKQYEATKPWRHPIGMTCQYSGGTDATLYASEADWVSPCTQLPPEATGTKVVINDTDHSYYWVAMKSDGVTRQLEWAWENFARGNGLGFMDPYLVVWPSRSAPGGTTTDPYVGVTPDPYWDVLRNALMDVRSYSVKIDLAHMTPQGALSTTGYCLANPGSQYLVFSASSGASFTLTTVAGTYTYEWFDPATHAVAQTGSVTVAGSHSFTVPFAGDAVLWLHD
jgi:hypothetical protein